MTDPAELPDRRRASRTALRLYASIREPGRGRTGAKLIDMSTLGCRIEVQSSLSIDSCILLSIAGLDTLYCRVVWSCHEFTGLEFASPIAERVFDQLMRRNSHPSETSVSELRSIANRAHRLSTQEDANRDILAELSRNCAVDAVVEGLRLREARH